MKGKLNSFLVLLALSSAAQAVTQYTSNPGTWNKTNTNWSADAATGGPYGSVWNNTTADVAVFEGTAGTVTVGENLNADSLDFKVTGYDLTAAGPVTLTGAGGTLYSLAAGVTATIGANVTLQSSSSNQNWTLSGANKTTSVLNLSGSITATTNNGETIRDMTVNVNTGGVLNGAASIVVGTSTDGSGSILNVSGGTLTIGGASTTASLVLNNANTGISADSTITLSGTGAITFAATSTGNGIRFGPTGTQSNAATNLVGTFNLDGGTLTTNKIFMGSINYSGGATYNATFNFNGGTLKALATNNTDFMGALQGTGYIVKSGGAKIDSNGKDITIARPLLHDSALGLTLDGGLTKEGLGTLTLSGANTYTGATTITGGKLAITAPYSAITATTINGGRLKITSNGTTPSALGTVSVNTGGFEFDLGTYNAANQPAVSVGTLEANANYTVDLAASSIAAGSHTITLLNFTTKTGSGLPSIGTLPVGVIVTSGPAYVGNSIQIGVTAVNLLTWSKGDGDWDLATSNWNANAALYAEPAVVTFPNLVEAGNGVNEVNVTTNPTPNSITIDNIGKFDTNAYSFSGSGGIAGSTGITKTGAGVVTFSNPNSYSGTLTISGGHVIKAAADTTSGNITVADTCTFALSGGIADGSGQTITLVGPGVGTTNIIAASTAIQRGSLQSLSGNNTWDGAIVLSGTAGTGGNTRIGVQNGASLTLNGNISEGVVGMSPFFRGGDTGTLTINGVGSWTGTTRLYSDGGAIKLGGTDRFPTGSLLTVGTTASSTTLDLTGNSQTVAGFGGVSAAKIINTGGASIFTSNPAAPATFPGVIQNNIALVIGGTAIQTLSGANTYTGNTTVNTGGALTLAAAGKLRFNPTTNGVTNSVSGTGTVVVDGKFVVDLTGATVANGNSWTLVNKSTLTATFNDTTFGIETSAAVAFTDPENDGVWTLVDGSNTWSFNEADGKLSVATAVSGYAAWQLANAPGQTVDQDHDYDGIKNGIEYFMGQSGNGFTANPPVISNTVTWPMGASYTGTYGTDYGVQTSSDLNTWTAATVGAGAGFVVVTPGTSVVYTLPTGSGKLFVRLLVNPN